MKNEQFKISDVAKRMGVSPSTVSRVLNDRPGVGEDLRQRVKDFIDEIGYKPNTLARSFTMGSINIIALIFGDVRNPYYADLAFHIQKYLNDAGYMVMVLNSEYDMEKELQFIDLACQFNFAGLILVTAQSSDRLKKKIKTIQIPVILVNRNLEGFTGDVILVDNFQAGYIATKHLVDLGHRDIAFLFGALNSSAISQRYQGYLQLLKNYQIEPKERNLFYGDLKLEDGFRIALEYAERIDELPSAVVVSNDLMAIGFIDGLKERDVKIPERVSVVSFDNILFSGLHGINLTTVDQKSKLMSEHAVRMILRRIEAPDSTAANIMIDPELIVRGTTAARDDK